MADILVVKVNMFCGSREFNKLCQYISDSAKTGVVVLPPYCDAQIVPDNVEIRVEDWKGE